LGAASRQRWLLFSRQPVAPGDSVTWNQLALTVQEVQSIPWLDQPLFFRAILQPAREVVA